MDQGVEYDDIVLTKDIIRPVQFFSPGFQLMTNADEPAEPTVHHSKTKKSK